MTETPTDAPTKSTEESTAGTVLDMLRQDDPQPGEGLATASPSRADKIYAGVSGFVMGIGIALAVLAAVYILYRIAFGETSDLPIDTE